MTQPTTSWELHSDITRSSTQHQHQHLVYWAQQPISTTRSSLCRNDRRITARMDRTTSSCLVLVFLTLLILLLIVNKGPSANLLQSQFCALDAEGERSAGLGWGSCVRDLDGDDTAEGTGAGSVL